MYVCAPWKPVDSEDNIFMETSFYKMKSAFLYLFVSFLACYPECSMTERKTVIRKISHVDVGFLYYQNQIYCIYHLLPEQ